ncbi:MAG: type II CRISPR RNA-guided endonuclease Cas9 [Alphaproteobacteria bacterium]|nr:type II CRISPR RNA-guided endonuclease Cas9 [Alphaproteobacteria bacterium]
MMRALIEHGFFPKDADDRKKLEKLEPLALRAKGLDQPLSPPEFARALFHINQRRGFKSNRKTNKKDNDSGALKTAIGQLRKNLLETGSRTVGEWLWKRHSNGLMIRARYRESRIPQEGGKTKIEKSYDLYIDRAMIESEFDTLWAKQAQFNPNLFNHAAHDDLKDCLLHQRPLKPVKPGRCTLIPEEERAPLALPSQQKFRIYQEVNHLRFLLENLTESSLTLEQRDKVVHALETNNKCTFTKIRKLIGLSSQFSIEDDKRTELKGNATAAILSKKEHFGNQWLSFSDELQDAIAMQLLAEENERKLITWLQQTTGIDEVTANRIANAQLPEGYGSLSVKALERVMPELKSNVVTYDKAVKAAGFDHHSNISHAATGEILTELPYYGEALQRHVGFGTGVPEHPPEKRYGKIANPTVHIGLNQIRTVVNALIKRYGHPSEVIVEVARELKQSKEQRKEEQKRQAENQNRNQRFREEISKLIGVSPDQVKAADVQKMILWGELNRENAADRRCPYSGIQISAHMLLSDQVEIEHILPFSRTLDDSLNNKTVAMRQANRIKGNRTPWEARLDFAAQGWKTEDMLARAEMMPKNKRYRFAENGYEQWLREDKGFLARALNDTRYLSRVAREYMSLICPQNTRVIPGQMTAMLRAKFGLNGILGLDGEKNRNDHRHHAVDACVIAVTDQGMLQRFASASASARERQLNKLVEKMPLPWFTYCEQVKWSVEHIWVSHKPDHGHEGAMHNDTAYALLGNDQVSVHKWADGKRVREQSTLKVIPMTDSRVNSRHGTLPNGDPRPYKGYKGDSNYCIEIICNEKGKWEGEVISTFEAYQLVRQGGIKRLRHPSLSCSGKPLVMRLMINDLVKFEIEKGTSYVGRIAKISGNGQIFMAAPNEANVDARNRDDENPFTYVSKKASSLQAADGRKAVVSPIGEFREYKTRSKA